GAPTSPLSTLFPYTTLFRSDFEILPVPAECDPGREVDPRLEDGDREAGRHYDVLAGIRVEDRSVVRTQRIGHRCCGSKGRHREEDRKSTRLNSSHRTISYAV